MRENGDAGGFPVAHLTGTIAPHNEYLRIGAEGGYVGLGLLVGLMFLWTVSHTRQLARTDRFIMRLIMRGNRGACRDRQPADLDHFERVVRLGFGGVRTRRAEREAAGSRCKPARRQMGLPATERLAHKRRAFIADQPNAPDSPLWPRLAASAGRPSRARERSGVRRELGGRLGQPRGYDAGKGDPPDSRVARAASSRPQSGRQGVLVGDTVGNEMLFLDPGTGEVRRRVPVADPYQLGFSPNGKWLTVNGLARNQVDVYDAATMKLVKRFPLASMPSHLAYAPDSSMVYVSLQGTNRLAAIDLTRMVVVWNVPRRARLPPGCMWHDGKVLVADMGSDDIAVVDPVDGQVERRIAVGRGAHQMFLSPDGRLIYVNARVDGTTTALDARTLEVRRVYSIPGGPDCIDFAPDGKLWITRRWAEKVAVLDPATGKSTRSTSAARRTAFF